MLRGEIQADTIDYVFSHEFYKLYSMIEDHVKIIQHTCQRGNHKEIKNAYTWIDMKIQNINVCGMQLKQW